MATHFCFRLTTLFMSNQYENRAGCIFNGLLACFGTAWT